MRESWDAPRRRRRSAAAWTRARRPARPTGAWRCPCRRRGGGCRWATAPGPSPCRGAPPACTAAPRTARPTPAPPRAWSAEGQGRARGGGAHLDVVVDARGVDAGSVGVGGDAQHLEAVGERLHRLPHAGVPQLHRGGVTRQVGASRALYRGGRRTRTVPSSAALATMGAPSVETEQLLTNESCPFSCLTRSMRCDKGCGVRAGPATRVLGASHRAPPRRTAEWSYPPSRKR